MKRCPKCQTDKPLAEFAKRAKSPDGLQSWCRSCNAARSKQYYAENTEKHKSVVTYRANTERFRQRQMLIEYKESHPCTDCGLHFPYYVMDFDHLDGKKCNVSSMPGNWSDATIWDEVAKCELVCSNCHRIRTHTRRVSGVMVAL